jgi:hypothetical protein
MQIPDLSYLESVPEDELILGSAGVTVTSEASAFGSVSNPFASANSSAKALSSGVSKTVAIGSSVAVGNSTTAKVKIVGDGDVVIKKNQSNFSQNSTVRSLVVVTISSP